jgi:hypothetical protein
LRTGFIRKQWEDDDEETDISAAIYNKILPGMKLAGAPSLFMYMAYVIHEGLGMNKE